jgi:hypothetical protein
MPTLRILAMAMAGAGILGGLTVTAARACDNDRYPCPIVSPAPDAADATKLAQPHKKANRAARQDDESRPKTKRQASQADSHAKPATPAEQATGSAPQNAADPRSALNDESPASAAPAASVVPPNTTAAAAEPAAETAAAALSANDVKVVDPHELNELDLAATSTPPAESSWLSYLLMTLGAALAAASGLRFLFV